MFTRLFATIVAAAAVAAFAAAPAQAQADVEAKVQVCNACHGANGMPLDPKTMPIIWGQQAYSILKELSDYRNGMREHPIMTPIAKTLAQADLRPIAAYFAAKPWPAHAAPPTPAPKPERIAMCVPCHQENFQGGVSWPRVAGQSYEYLLAQMNAFAKEERTNNGDMPKIMQMFSEAERDAMARYLAGL
jgi:cytochrome c553